MALLRLDKYLAQSGEHSRKEAALLVRKGLVQVDGLAQRDPAQKIDPALQAVTLKGEAVGDAGLQYYVLHKPAGVLTAARDSRAQTVMDLLPEAFLRRKVLPVGRLDKDSTGLLLLTNDGELAHFLLSPKRHILKEYHVQVTGCLAEEAVRAFDEGIALSDFIAKPAQMRIIRADAETSDAIVWLSEGKFHQVKRMFAACGHEVRRLHRAAFGSLRLPDDLPEGVHRALTADELSALKNRLNSPD